MTNTERLIADYWNHIKYTSEPMTFAVGRYTGNGVAVVAALRKRGFTVERNPRTCPQSYDITAAPTQTLEAAP